MWKFPSKPWFLRGCFLGGWDYSVCCPSRTALLIVLLACLEMTYVLEQPTNSVMLLHPRLYWAFKQLRKLAKMKVS